MTRIIAGSAGGRRIGTPRGAHTRPTTDRVREALFSRVGALLDLDGAAVLDLYAGSGALGLEAASRGAARVLLVESHSGTARLAAGNARELGLAQRVAVAAQKVERVLERGPGGTAYDLVLVDPPYPLSEEALALVLRLLVRQRWLAADAVVVVERSARSPRPAWPEGLGPLGSRAYGETVLHLAEATSPSERAPGPADTMQP